MWPLAEADDLNASPVSSEEAVNTMMKIMQALGAPEHGVHKGEENGKQTRPN